MENEIKNWREKEGTIFLRRVGIELDQTVLDFGCKNGNYTIPAARIVGKNGVVYSLDKNKNALNELQEKIMKDELENIGLIETDGSLEIGLEDGSVDVVLLYDVIHLVGKNDSSTMIHRKKLYEEVYRIAKNNALISVYPTHLVTNTDISSIEEVKEELTQYFQFERELSARLIHDDNFVNGKILNFRKLER